MGKIEIEKVDTHEGFLEVERLQKEIWGMEDIAVVPNHLMIPVQRHGGLLLGAFDGDEMIGFVFGFTYIEEDMVKHYSLMCGVKQNRCFQGVGYRLKKSQREHIISQGCCLAIWTFDPLKSLNAYFNLEKLGVITNQYYRNFYGNLRDQINEGLETDRFLVNWWLMSPRVKSKFLSNQKGKVDETFKGFKLKDMKVINHCKWNEDGILECGEYELELEDETLLVEIPEDIGEILKKNPDLVVDWRVKTREIFEEYFSRGYIASEFIRKGKQSLYLLKKVSEEEISGGTFAHHRS
jgi:predicted GNAT superfamily acetyltransferase